MNSKTPKFQVDNDKLSFAIMERLVARISNLEKEAEEALHNEESLQSRIRTMQNAINDLEADNKILHEGLRLSEEIVGQLQSDRDTMNPDLK